MGQKSRDLSQHFVTSERVLEIDYLGHPPRLTDEK